MPPATKTGAKCACRGQTLDRFLQPVILSILAREPLTGYAAIKRMREYVTFADAGPDPTGTYRYLKTMETRGLIRRDEARGDSDTSLYHITGDGLDCLANWVGTLRAYEQTIHTLADEIERGCRCRRES